jgi:signal transduction histidine kinase
MERSTLLFLALILVCAAGIAAFLIFYFSAYLNLHIQRETFDLSEGWQYESSGLAGGETMTLTRTLDISVPEAAVLIRANHQSISVYLDGIPLFAGPVLEPGENPGIASHLISLPDGYTGKTLKIEVASPYAAYSGWISSVLLGARQTLAEHAQSAPLRPVITMLVCLVAWIPIGVVTFMRKPGGGVRKEQLAIGVFVMFWGMYYVAARYDVLPFLTPVQRSVFVLAVYFLQMPSLTMFFYFAFERYKKPMLPAAVVFSAASAAALALQFSGLADLPRLLICYDILIAIGILYTVVLAVLEAKAKNRLMKLTVPFFIAAYVFAMYANYTFYTQRGVISQDSRDLYFWLIVSILIYSIWHFFRDIYGNMRESERLAFQKNLAQESYEHITTHFREVARLKHDFRSHLTAIQTYLDGGRFEEAKEYLARYTSQSATVTETVFSEHILLNAVLGNLYRRAGEHGIRLELEIKAAPLRIADPDLYSLLTNVINNAFEACIAMPANAERFIRLNITRHEPYLNIRCVNSKAGEIISEDGKIQTTKTGKGHGYGLQTVGRIVDAYDGMISLEHDENTFTVKAALKDRQPAGRNISARK